MWTNLTIFISLVDLHVKKIDGINASNDRTKSKLMDE